jgi:hypothetical protein
MRWPVRFCSQSILHHVSVTTPAVALLALRVRDARERAVFARARLRLRIAAGLLADHLVALAALPRRVLAPEEDVKRDAADQACEET